MAGLPCRLVRGLGRGSFRSRHAQRRRRRAARLQEIAPIPKRQTGVDASQLSTSGLSTFPGSDYVFDLWVDLWRRKAATGDVIIVRYADDLVMGFQHRADAVRFLEQFKEQLAKFGLELHPEKTRLIEFGRYAANKRKQWGKGKPETPLLRATSQDRHLHRLADHVETANDCEAESHQG